jgi:hypothetical protein
MAAFPLIFLPASLTAKRISLAVIVLPPRVGSVRLLFRGGPCLQALLQALLKMMMLAILLVLPLTTGHSSARVALRLAEEKLNKRQIFAAVSSIIHLQALSRMMMMKMMTIVITMIVAALLVLPLTTGHLRTVAGSFSRH